MSRRRSPATNRAVRLFQLWLSLSETLYGWPAGANRMMLMLDGRCFRPAVVCPHRLVSLKSATRSGNPCSPAADQCAAAQIPEEICFRQFRSIAIRWAVSPRSWHCGRAGHRPPRDGDPLAPRWISIVLALQIEAARREAESAAGDPSADPGHELGQPALGRTSHPWRAAEARHRYRPDKRCKVHGAGETRAVTGLEDVSLQSR